MALKAIGIGLLVILVFFLGVAFAALIVLLIMGLLFQKAMFGEKGEHR